MPVTRFQPRLTRRGARHLISRTLIFSLVAGAAFVHVSPASAAEAKIDGVAWTASRCVQPQVGETTQAALPLILLGLLLPKLAEGGLTYIGNAIAKAGAPVEHHASADASTSLYMLVSRPPKTDSANPPNVLAYDENPALALRHRCVVAVFGLVRPTATPRTIGRLEPIPLMPGGRALDPSLLAAIDLNFDPNRVAVLVAELVTSPDQTAFQFAPRYIQFVGALMEKRTAQQRSDVFTVSILAPGAAADGAATAVRTFSFPDVSSPMTKTGAEADALRSSWIPLPAPPDAVKAKLAATTSRRSDYNSLLDSLPAKATPDEVNKAKSKQDRLATFIADDNKYLAEVAPVTFRVDFVETRPGSKFVVALGKALAANAKDLSAPIAEQLDPTKRAAAAAAEADNQDTLRIGAINAATDLQKAKDAGDPAALRVAQIKAAAACRKLEAAGYADPSCVEAP